jgi:hypothetical protein
MDIKKILGLLAKKHPTNYKRGVNPAILIYDDESGRIFRDASNPGTYSSENTLLEFASIKELVDYLTDWIGEPS